MSNLYQMMFINPRDTYSNSVNDTIFQNDDIPGICDSIYTLYWEYKWLFHTLSRGNPANLISNNA